MTNYPNMHAMASSATDKYLDITSLEQISKGNTKRFPAGFPAKHSPNWWALRLRVQAIIGKQQRMAGAKFSRDEYELAQAAEWLELDNPDAQHAYEAINPETGMHVLESAALRQMRQERPEQYAQVIAECKRRNEMGRRTITLKDLLK